MSGDPCERVGAQALGLYAALTGCLRRKEGVEGEKITDLTVFSTAVTLFAKVLERSSLRCLPVCFPITKEAWLLPCAKHSRHRGEALGILSPRSSEARGRGKWRNRFRENARVFPSFRLGPVHTGCYGLWRDLPYVSPNSSSDLVALLLLSKETKCPSR